MRITHRARHAAGAGLALAGIFTIVAGCTMSTADEAGESADRGIVETEEAITSGIYSCRTLEAQEASLIASEDGTCIRYRTHIAGASKIYCHGNTCQPCRSVSRKVGCLKVRVPKLRHYIGNDEHTYRCTMAGATIVGALVVRPDETCSRIPSLVDDAETDFCVDGVCPSCWSLGRDLDCLMTN